MKNRGMLTDEIQKISKDFLGREITIRELRLYPFLDYCLKNDWEWNLSKLNKEEKDILEELQDAKHLIFSISIFRCTKEFYDYIQLILAESYVPEFVTKEDLSIISKNQ